MTVSSPTADAIGLQAASFAAALLRFESGAAHPDRTHTPPELPRVGDDAYMFIPVMRRVARVELPAYLAALPSPALLAPTTIRGMVALILVHELAGPRAAGARRILANQRAMVEAMAERLQLGADAPVVLEFDDEVHVVSVASLRVWSERYAIQVGWSFRTLTHDARASARVMLYRSDGAESWGGSCPVRPSSP